jgi:hypothetical protein
LTRYHLGTPREKPTKDGPRSGTWDRYSVSAPHPSFAPKCGAEKRIKQKSCPSTVWAFRPKKGAFFCPALWEPRSAAQGRTSRVAFSFGYFSFGDAKEQVPRLPGRDPACNRRLHNKNTTKLIANKPTNPPARTQKHVIRHMSQMSALAPALREAWGEGAGEPLRSDSSLRDVSNHAISFRQSWRRPLRHTPQAMQSALSP